MGSEVLLDDQYVLFGVARLLLGPRFELVFVFALLVDASASVSHFNVMLMILIINQIILRLLLL
jgi:hypothetical protein